MPDSASPLGSERSKASPLHRPVVQISAKLVAKKGDTKAAAVAAIHTVLAWIENKQLIPLPASSRDLEDFEIDASEGGHPVEAVQFDGFWSIQYDKLDPEIAGRIWRTEATVAYDEMVSLAGMRLAVIDSAQPAVYATSVPSVVTEWIRSPGLLDGCGRFLDNRAAIIDSTLVLDEWERVLRHPRRTHPVILFSSTRQLDRFAVASAAATRLAGLAHVAVIDEQCARVLTERVGKEFSVWHGAVRTFQPAFNPASDESRIHPLATADWLARRFSKEDYFISAVQHTLATQSVRSADVQDVVPSFKTIKHAAMERRLRSLTTNSSEHVELTQSQNRLLSQKVEELKTQYDYAASEVAQAEAERDKYRAMVMALRAQNEQIRLARGATAASPEFPDSLEELDEWAEKNLAGRLLLLTRAARAARKSPFNDPALVYKCLDRLATTYVAARRAGDATEGLFEDLGVQLDRTGDEVRLRQWKEHYFVPHRGQTRFLEWHLTRGSDKNEAHTMRIYFFYDEDDEHVVVGHLPGHLPNSKS